MSFLMNLLLALKPVASRIPALPAIPADYSGIEQVGSCAASFQKCIEPAGAAFQTLCASRAVKSPAAAGAGRRAGAKKDAEPGGEDREGDEMGEDEKKKLLLLLDSHDHYAMLGLESLNVNATDDQIKKAYRRMVLRYHPDKQSSADGGAVDKTDPLFLAIQKAYDTLSNDKLRRQFDSQYQFDDAIPSGSETISSEQDFFRLYGPVFERNSRWSATKPVPLLGSPDDEDEKVVAFYNFWFAFQTWRDFNNLAEHKPEDAESREERRWMERENEKSIAKHKKAEVQRIYDLAHRAYNRDPRMARILKAEEDAKQAAREAKLQAKRAVEDEVKRQAAEKAAREAAEEEAKKQEAAAKKAAKEKEKKAVKRLRAEYNTLLVAAGTDEETVELDTLFASGRWDSAALAELLAKMQITPGEEAVEQLKEAIAAEKAAKVSATAAASTAAVAAASAAVKPKREWTVPEAASLAKGVARFPPGTKNRWVMIADYVNGFGHGEPRTPDECITKSRSMGEEDKRKANQQAYQLFQAARAKDPEIKDKDAPAVPVVAPVAAVEKPAAATPTVAVSATETRPDAWSAAQQTALEKALRTYPATMEKNERWTAIAAAVGKSKKECIERFKEVREKVLAAKAGAGSTPAATS